MCVKKQKTAITLEKLIMEEYLDLRSLYTLLYSVLCWRCLVKRINAKHDVDDTNICTLAFH